MSIPQAERALGMSDSLACPWPVALGSHLAVVGQRARQGELGWGKQRCGLLLTRVVENYDVTATARKLQF